MGRFRMPSRGRSRLSRSPLLFWLAVAGLAMATAMVVGGAIGEARSLAGRYGPLVPVVVAAAEVGPGSEVAAGELSVQMVPSTFVPPGAFAAPLEVEGRTTATPLLAGQVVLAGHLAPGGLSGVAALLPEGTRAVTVPAGGATSPPLERGDMVDLLATLDRQPALAIVLDAPVVDVADGAVTVAVRPEEARSVAYALANGSVTVTLTPGPTRSLAPGPAQAQGLGDQRGP
jgi:hypothetical protein